MTRNGAWLAWLCLCGTLAAQNSSPPTYWQEIRPLFRKYCTVCHSQKNLQEVDVSGGLALDSYEAALKSPKKPVIVPGKSRESLLYQLLITSDPDRRMPKGSSEALPKPVIETIARWIDAGAPEGQRPEDTAVSISPRPLRRVRHLDIVLATGVTPPAGLVKVAKPGPLELVLPVGPLAPVTAVRYHPSRPLLAVGQYGRITIWDLAQAQPIRVLTNVLGAVNDLRFSPDGSLLAAAGGQPSFKGDLRVYRTDTWELVATLRGHEDSVFCVAFSPDGKRLASASFDKTVRIWNLQTQRAEVVITGHSDFVYALGFSPDGRWVASASKDRSVKIFDAGTGKSLVTLSGMNLDVTAVAIHPNGKELVSAGFEPALVWWSTEPGAQRSGDTIASGGQRIRTQGGHGATVHELVFSRDGKLLASASADGTVRLWNGQTGQPLQTWFVGSVQYAVDLRPDGGQIAAGGFDGIVRIFDTKSARGLAQLLSLSDEQGHPLWLVLVPEGYVAASPSLLTQIRWRIHNQPIDPQLIQKALVIPERVRQSLSLQKVEPPFSK